MKQPNFGFKMLITLMLLSCLILPRKSLTQIIICIYLLLEKMMDLFAATDQIHYIKSTRIHL